MRGHWEIWVKCISRYWELTLGNGDGLGAGAEGALRREEAGCSTSTCLVPWEWGRE